MKKILITFILLFFINLSFPQSKEHINPYHCWDFADAMLAEESISNDFYDPYGMSYEDEHNYWTWVYDMCMDGLIGGFY